MGERAALRFQPKAEMQRVHLAVAKITVPRDLWPHYTTVFGRAIKDFFEPDRYFCKKLDPGTF
jgi:hypothetical protein